MKRAHLRPQALADRKDVARYYRREASPTVAENMIAAIREALNHLEQHPGTGSPRIGQTLSIPGLRSWRVSGFPLIWFYFERNDCLDVVRLLGERQDILSILNAPDEETQTAMADARQGSQKSARLQLLNCLHGQKPTGARNWTRNDLYEE